MLTDDGQFHMSMTTSITVCASDQHTWANDILSHLEERGYAVHRIAVVDTQHLMPNGSPPDAIVTVNLKDSISLDDMLKDHPEFKPMPLRVLITETQPVSVPDGTIDLVLPPDAGVVERQIKQSVELKRENERLQQQINAMQADYNQLKDQLDAQKKVNHSVEVLKTAIVRNVSHELKTPLLQVKSAVSLLAEDVKDEKLINYAKNATARLETLVKNITMLGSSLDTNMSTVIVRDAVEYARRNLRRIWMQQDSPERIVIKLEDNLSPVRADKQGISTVLQLLLDNALKFSEEKVEVIAKKQDDAYIYVAVKDYGIGIAPEDVERIFDAFFQVDGSSTRRYGGTGVGLAIVKIILDNHDMEIHVDSKVGEGSTFWFLLPAVEF